MADPDLPAGFTPDDAAPALPDGFQEDAPSVQHVLHTFATKGPDGAEVRFQAPSDASDDDVRQAAAKATGSKLYLGSQIMRDGSALPAHVDGGLWTGFEHAADSFSAGLLHPVSAALDTIIPGVGHFDGTESAWTSGKGLAGTYHDNLASLRGQSDADAQAHAGSALTGTVVGTLTSPINKIAAPVRGAGLFVNAARAGAGAASYGLIHGAATSQADGVGGVAKDAARESLYSGAAGAGMSAGLQGLIGAGQSVLPAVGRLLRNSPAPNAAIDLIESRLAADGVTPADAGTAMTTANANGVPAMLADMGENVRALGGSVSRQPGAARTTAMAATTERQLGQGDRVRDAINRDLGATTDTFAEANRLQAQAKADAAPLYAAFHANPSRTSDELVSLTETPAGRSAMAKARTIAANDRVPANKLGFELDNEGNVKLVQNPSPQTLDYVKQGLDDVLEGYRDTTTGKLNLTPSGRSVENVRSNFVREMDRLYPDYAPARAAYGGPASLKTALADGRSALNKSADEINQRLTNMTPAEQGHYALGLRSAISDKVSAAPDGANVVRQLVGSDKKRQALARVFGGTANLDRFTSTLSDEQSAFKTYATVNTGSPTAGRVGEDAANADIGKIGRLVDLGSAAQHGVPGLLGYGVSRIGGALQYGAGQAGQRTREDAASLLFSSDPSEFGDALKGASTRRLVALGQRNLTRQKGADIGGRLGGRLGALIGGGRQ